MKNSEYLESAILVLKRYKRKMHYQQITKIAIKLGHLKEKKDVNQSDVMLTTLIRHSKSNNPKFLNNGERYEGKYHLHQSTGQAMTGSKHSDESKNLYIKHYFRNKSSDKLYLANRINRRKNPNFKILVSKQNSVERNN